MPERGPALTIREAVAVALEASNVGDLVLFVNLAKQRDALREHVVRWVQEYAAARGVLGLDRKAILDELAQIIAELRSGLPLRGKRFEKIITFCGQKAKVACDGKCEKAWGGQHRPRVYLGEGNENGERDPDDYAYLSDAELGDAPADPGTTEGSHGKPVNATDAKHMNKWCVRECERCAMSMPGEYDRPLVPPDFTHRFYNKKPHRRD